MSVYNYGYGFGLAFDTSYNESPEYPEGTLVKIKANGRSAPVQKVRRKQNGDFTYNVSDGWYTESELTR